MYVWWIYFQHDRHAFRARLGFPWIVIKCERIKAVSVKMHTFQQKKKSTALDPLQASWITRLFRVHFPIASHYSHHFAPIFAPPGSAEDLVLIFGTGNSRTMIRCHAFVQLYIWTNVRPLSPLLCRKLPPRSLGQQFGMHRQIREIFGQTKGCDAVAVFLRFFPAGCSPRHTHQPFCCVQNGVPFYITVPCCTMVLNDSKFVDSHTMLSVQ